MVAEHRLDCLRFWQWDFDYDLEPAPDSGVEELRMIGGRQEQAVWWPFVDLLKQYRDKALQLSDLTCVVAALRHSVEFVQEQDAVVVTGVVKHRSQIAPSPPEEGTHDRREVEDGKRLRQFTGNPLGCERLSYPWGTGKEYRPCRIYTSSRQPLDLVTLSKDLPQDS